MERKLNNNLEQKSSRNEKEKSLLMIYISLPLDSFNQIILKNPNLVNTIDNYGDTLLSYAIKEKKIDICQNILTSKLLDLNYQDKKGNTYLHLAVLYELEKLILLLIEKGIDINKKNKNGNTALNLANLNHLDKIIHLLQNNKSDLIINKKDKMDDHGLNIDKKTQLSKPLSRGRNTKGNSKKKEKKNIDNSDLTANSSKNNKIKKNMKSIKEPNIYSKNLKINLLFEHGEKSNIKKIESLPTLREKQNNLNNDNKKIKNQTSNNRIQNVENEKKPKNKALIIDNKQLNSEKSSNSKMINVDIGNNTSSETKFKTLAFKDKLSKTNNMEEQDKLEDNQMFDFDKEDDLFRVDDLNNDINQNPYFNSNKLKTFREEEEFNKKEAYEKIMKKYIEEVMKNSKNKNEKDSDENNSQNKEDVEYSIRFESESSDEDNMDKNKSNISDTLLNIEKNFKNKNKKTRNNNKLIKENNNKENFFFDSMDENQFSKTLVKKPKKKKLDKLSNKSSEDNNEIEYENPMIYQIYQDKQRYNNNLKDLLKNDSEKTKEIDPNKTSKGMKEPLLFPESEHMPKDLKELDDIVKNNSLNEFLAQINMKKYTKIFIENGFDDMKIIIEQAQKGIYIKDSELKEAGILLPGDRAKILIRIQEKANNFKFAIPKNVYYTCKNVNKINSDINIKNLRNWLKNLRIDCYLKNFVDNGYHSIELLFLQMESQSPLTAEILKEEIGIDKIGHRSRIINKLKEDGRSYINQLKTSVLLVGNANNNKFCDCIVC